MILKRQVVKNLSCTIKDKLSNLMFQVSPKAAINDEYLKQEITSAQGRKETIAYTFADAAKQAALVEKIEAAKAILENHDASQENSQPSLE